MRRKDREVRDIQKITGILAEAQVCRLGFYDSTAQEVYIVPLNYGWQWQDADTEPAEGCGPQGSLQLYFHGAKEGRKLELIAQAEGTSSVGFEIETGFALHPADTACSHSAAFKSIIGNGRVEMVTDGEEKIAALGLIMRHYTGRSWEFTDAQAEAVAVFRLTVSTLSCKEHA